MRSTARSGINRWGSSNNQQEKDHLSKVAFFSTSLDAAAAVDESGDGDTGKDSSKLWALQSVGSYGASAVESLLLGPIHEVAAFAEEHIIAPTGEVISHTGEVISHLTSDIFSGSGRSGGGGSNEDVVDGMGEEMELQQQPYIDIRPRHDREEVELIARPSDDSDESYFVSDSLLLEDLTGMEDQMFTMNLKVIRGKHLPFNKSRLRVSVLNENGVIDQVLGTTPWSAKDQKNPIWGTASCSWSLMGIPSTQLIFSLEEDVEGDDGSTEKKDDGLEESHKTQVFAKVDAVDLMVLRNPNIWIKLHNHGSTEMEYCGHIRVRLSRPKMATLHQQENCPKITPGPAFPRMESYAIRKQVMYACSPVILNVYDVSNDNRINAINNTVKRMGYGGIFHAAIQINGKEYSFGGTRDSRSKVTGIFCSRPKNCPMHHYRESVYLGDCELTTQQVHYILEDLRPKWLAKSYNLFRKNCVFFCRELAAELGVGDIPEWVFSLASTAEFIEPYAIKLNTYLTQRTTKATNITSASVKDAVKAKKQTNFSSNEEAERIAVVLEDNGSMEVQRVATTTQESLLDHAMAARIQRSFRAYSTTNNMKVLALFLMLSAVSAFAPAFTGRPLSTGLSKAALSSPTALEMKYTIVLVRHGESTWNDENRFTGWYDCPLSEAGLKEAHDGAKLLKQEGFTFDVAYTSTLQRAIKTLWIILEEMHLMYIPIVNTWRLNERHYGSLQGLNKQETVDKHGKDQVQVWRRSYDIPPPPCDESSEYYPGNDPMYADVNKDLLPYTESLKLTEERFLVEWDEKMVPLIKSGKKVIIAAHGNTLRALVKHLDGISSEEITDLNIPTGVPLVYELDENMKPIKQGDAIPPLTGKYLGDLEQVKKRIGAVVAQTK